MWPTASTWKRKLSGCGSATGKLFRILSMYPIWQMHSIRQDWCCFHCTKFLIKMHIPFVLLVKEAKREEDQPSSFFQRPLLTSRRRARISTSIHFILITKVYSLCTLHHIPPFKSCSVDLDWMKRALCWLVLVVVSIHDVTNRLFSHGTSGGGGISPPTSGTPFSGSPGIMTEYWIVRSATWQWSLAFSHFVNRTPSLKCPNFLVDLNGCQNALIFAKKKLNGLWTLDTWKLRPNE